MIQLNITRSSTGIYFDIAFLTFMQKLANVLKYKVKQIIHSFDYTRDIARIQNYNLSSLS